MKRPAVQDKSDELEGEEDFELEAQEEPTATEQRPKKGKAKKGKKRKTAGKPAQIVSYRYPDKRVNNPEVGMVHPENDPDQPKTVWRYDPHLDPALQFDSTQSRVEALIDDALASEDSARMREALAELKRLQAPHLNWTGKAERTTFEVDTVSLHVHERVDPASILAAVRKRKKSEKAESEVEFQPGLFDAPFENLPLRQALDFYKHPKHWSNRLVAGDSLLVMNSLLNKESMAGQVQMVYIDPPYGIKYGSNFQPFTNKRDVKDGSDADLTQEPEMIKAFRDTWELGVHSYLTYLRDRLLLTKELLHQSGSVFVQISAENLHRARLLLDEIFQPENYIETIAYRTKNMTLGGEFLEGVFDYIIWYCKDRSTAKFRRLYAPSVVEGDSHWNYYWRDGRLEKMTSEQINNHADLPEGADPVQLSALYPTGIFETGLYEFEFQGKPYNPPPGRCWKSPKIGLDRLNKAGRLVPYSGGETIRYALRHSDYPVSPLHNIWADTAPPADKIYAVQTGHKVIERCLLMTTDPGDLVFDPTCGSGTTAYCAEKWGRRWITCDTSRVAITLAKQRLMTSSFDYYALRYPHEGLRGGFIYETVSHVTLKSITNNPEIDDIYGRLHPGIQTALGRLNDSLRSAPPFVATQGIRKDKPVTFRKGDSLYEWEVPADFPEAWPVEARRAFDEFHESRSILQHRMDESILAHGERETLYDQCQLDPGKMRISGPFTVEAVPNPTVLPFDEASINRPADASVARSGQTSRQGEWRDELVKAGIRGKGGQKLTLADLEPIPGLRNLHATGTVAETGERIVVSFGPEHAALEQRQVELALTEAEKLRPAPKLVVFCAFAFDPEAAKDIDEVNWPGINILRVQMNTDLLTEDLKKARGSNESFWLMGQPDVELRALADGRWKVEVHGFDYFDTKKGELVSGGKSKIAMWSLDPDYDQRSLYPHQLFFPMAGKKEGWHRLRKSIRAELNESLLDRFHGTVSLPFEAGENQCIAVKIVDDRGIESLKVIPLNR